MNIPLKNALPQTKAAAFVAPNATLCGQVVLEEGSSVWYGAVLRGDMEAIHIGPGSNIQDNCVLHADPGLPCVLERDVTVGHGAILHSCTIGEESLIGMGAILLNGAKIGRRCIVAAGALVTQNTVVPDESLVLGSPAKVVRPLRPEEIESNRQAAAEYRHLSQLHGGR